MAKEKHYLEAELEALIASERQFWKDFLAATLEGVWFFDCITQEDEYFSPEFWTYLGYDPETKAHRTQEWRDIIFEDDRKALAEGLSLHLADPDQPIDQIVRYIRADGSTAWLRCRGLAFRDKDGTPTRVLGTHSDLTDFTQQRQTNRSNELYGTIMRSTHSAIVGLNEKKKIVSINTPGRHILGGVDGLAPVDWPEDVVFVDEESMQPLLASKNPIERSLAGATLRSEIFVMTRKNNIEPRYVRISSSPVDADGGPVRCVLIIDDVSEQEKHRQQIERSSRLDALGQLTGGIAHDFNNLLATIQYALQLAVDMGDVDRQKIYLETALKSVNRGSRLTSRLLTFAKKQPGLSKSNRVNDVITDFRRLAAPLIEENITLEFADINLDLFVYCDAAQLENALLNLLLNSRDVITRTGTGDRIVISARGISELDGDVTLRREHPNSFIAKSLLDHHKETSEREDGTALRYIEFAVTDNGPGMSAEIKRRATDPFFTTKNTNSGTGLGLSMVYGFVQQSSGELRIYSEEEQGTTVRMLLPRGTESGAREAPIDRVPQEFGSGEVILVVEDEPSLLLMMEDILDSLGYGIVTARTAKDALEQLDTSDDLSLVITDIVMPGGMGGFELAKEIRKRQPDMPILYMSGYTGFSESEMNEVVAPMIQKPCPPAELAHAIKTALK